MNMERMFVLASQIGRPRILVVSSLVLAQFSGYCDATVTAQSAIVGQ